MHRVLEYDPGASCAWWLCPGLNEQFFDAELYLGNHYMGVIFMMIISIAGIAGQVFLLSNHISIARQNQSHKLTELPPSATACCFIFPPAQNQNLRWPSPYLVGIASKRP